jgi:hypothetical protein
MAEADLPPPPWQRQLERVRARYNDFAAGTAPVEYVMNQLNRDVQTLINARVVTSSHLRDLQIAQGNPHPVDEYEWYQGGLPFSLRRLLNPDMPAEYFYTDGQRQLDL